MPGNDRFQVFLELSISLTLFFFKGRVEFTTVAKHYLPKWGFYLTLALFITSLLSQIISAIVVSAQVSATCRKTNLLFQTMDLALIAIFKKTFAIEVELYLEIYFDF
jgi:hypothetical protein